MTSPAAMFWTARIFEGPGSGGDGVVTIDVEVGFPEFVQIRVIRGPKFVLLTFQILAEKERFVLCVLRRPRVEG